ncbi:hypothetical protein [Steroidobacter sp.]|uniref:hypothetical protein n=1 Tax=Steroidobacter sp. TaxID=1978227 RepID=UPI001A534EBB|nr:hypothetical protein [Steroidobacter sp.]MBL8266737.1 hypothetical protein [Steroidobacter sp.]
MPFDTSHAHISSAASMSAEVHSGHSHDLEPHPHPHPESVPETGDQVVDLQGSVSAQNTFQSMFWSNWIPLACLVALAFLVAQPCIAVFSPPSSDPNRASRRGHWRPPLRGPPVFSIR